jgi:hypothetical protein
MILYLTSSWFDLSKSDIEVPSHEIIAASSKYEIQQCFDVVELTLILPPEQLT